MQRVVALKDDTDFSVRQQEIAANLEVGGSSYFCSSVLSHHFIPLSKLLGKQSHVQP